MSEMRMEEERSAKIIENLKRDMHDILKNYEDSLRPFLLHYRQLRDKDVKDMSQHIENARIIHKKEVKIWNVYNIGESVTKQSFCDCFLLLFHYNFLINLC